LQKPDKKASNIVDEVKAKAASFKKMDLLNKGIKEIIEEFPPVDINQVSSLLVFTTWPLV